MSYIYNPRRVLGSTGHILRHVFETVIAEPLLGGSREKSRSVAALAPAYRYFADHDDLIVSIPDRELAIGRRQRLGIMTLRSFSFPQEPERERVVTKSSRLHSNLSEGRFLEQPSSLAFRRLAVPG